MKIKYLKDNEDYLSIIIEDEQFDFEDSNYVTIPAKILENVNVNDIDENIEIHICEKIQDGTIFLGPISYSLTRIGDNKLLISFHDYGNRKYWDGDIGFKLYMETKMKIIQEREKEIKDIRFGEYDDEGNWISIKFYAEIDSFDFITAINQAEQIIEEIEGALNLTLGSYYTKISDTDNEKELTLRVVIPLLRKLGFINIKYNHGKREFGRDIIFARITEFDELEYWGVQLKYGDICGAANSGIDIILSQAESAFSMPFFDVYSRTKQRISKLVIIASGKFTENSVEKICEGIEKFSLKNNLVFMDGDKIETLCEKFGR